MKQPLNIALLLGLLAVASIYATQKKENNNFLANPDILKTGIVHKYYYSITEKGGYTSETDIEYRYYQQGKTSNELIEKRYNPAFKQDWESTYQLQGNKVKLEQRSTMNWYGDTLNFGLGDERIYLNFGTDEALSEVSISYPNGFSRHITQETRAIGDTLINEMPAKIVTRNRTIVNTKVDQTVDTTEVKIKEIYVQNFGLWSMVGEDDKQSYELILVEQLLPEPFKKMAQHDMKRVGYIDFDKTLDKEKPFSLCKRQIEMVDYYNSSDVANRAHFIGGKKPLKAYVFDRLEEQKLHKESGYLTFRFVVNCEGKAGRFTTDQSSFEYAQKEFHPETVQHLYEILKSVPQWSPNTGRGQIRDAYTYITFILKDGKITELLP